MTKCEHRSSSKKARVESTPVQVHIKEEMVEATAPPEELTVKIYKDKLHCPVCTRPFKPPIFQFQCEAGHPACGACHARLRKDRCYSCGCDGTYRRNTNLEDVLTWLRILCPYERYGCRASIAYHEAGDHQLECPWAPCRCSEPGCTFVGSPSMLCDHLAAAPHSWPVDKIRYGSVVENIDLPVSLPRRLLVAEEDGRVFLVSSRAMGSCFHGASVVCIRASAAAGPKYRCEVVWSRYVPPGRSDGSDHVNVSAEVFTVRTWEVPSCSDPSKATAEEMVLLVMRNKSLPEPSMEMSLGVTIERVLPA